MTRPTYREIYPVYPAKSRLTLSDNPDKSMFVKFWLTAFRDSSFFNRGCSLYGRGQDFDVINRALRFLISASELAWNDPRGAIITLT
jgi:hypothetical protein